jgi:hypothetical protein
LFVGVFKFIAGAKNKFVRIRFYGGFAVYLNGAVGILRRLIPWFPKKTIATIATSNIIITFLESKEIFSLFLF